MSEWTVDIDDKEIDVALEQARTQPPTPRALSAQYNAQIDVIVFRLDTGRRLVIPREEIEGLQGATPAQLSKIDLYAGTDVDWPLLGVNHYLPHFLEGKYGSRKWMASLQREVIAA